MSATECYRGWSAKAIINGREVFITAATKFDLRQAWEGIFHTHPPTTVVHAHFRKSNEHEVTIVRRRKKQ